LSVRLRIFKVGSVEAGDDVRLIGFRAR